MSQGNYGTLLTEVAFELEQATKTHGPLNSAHEAYAVMLEEVEEFWAEVKLKRNLRSKDRMRNELVQVAAMALRTIIDVVEKYND